jgi:hypothetical protein
MPSESPDIPPKMQKVLKRIERCRKETWGDEMGRVEVTPDAV